LAKYIDKQKILKATRQKKSLTYKGRPIRPATDLSTETLQARREWHDIFDMVDGKNLQPRILYPARLSLRIERERVSQTNKN